MANGKRKKGLKSVESGKPMRSRGFLSHPGGQTQSASEKDTASDSGTKHHKSRGARQISASPDGNPQDLSVKPNIKPYTLEDK